MGRRYKGNSTDGAKYQELGELRARCAQLQSDNKRLKEKIKVLGLAADLTVYTKEQLSENKKLKEENRWIPASERLPEDNSQYLVCDFEDMRRPVFVVSWFNARTKEFNYSSATHWKPIILPE